jgi:16S rRNA (uracil1498-N3)-methyltransferase
MIPRFFINPDQLQNGMVEMDTDDTHHLRTVLHAQPGDRIVVLDNTGVQYNAVIDTVGKHKASALIHGKETLDTEARTKITIAQALPKMADKMEQVLQRGTEVGASAFWAFSGERSLTHLTGERQAKRLVRWSAIVKTAAEQSHRALLPLIRCDQTYQEVLDQAPNFDLSLLAYEGDCKSLRDCLTQLETPPATVLIIIGPEAGISDSEVKAARKYNISPISLGQRILRTETAALVLASQLIYALE